ncbi:MAG: sensor histidine kinase [Conexibacter sp.]|nr:sensor histidine kinase [Conexibacter sp.]
MATDDGPLKVDADAAPGGAVLLTALGADDWSTVLEAVGAAETWLRSAPPGDTATEAVLRRLAALGAHEKWEIRRAVANAAAQVPHAVFDRTLARLATDDNRRVRQAAELASLRRRDARHASALGRQHEDRINATLDDIEARFGVRGRDAVKRAAEQVADAFARELYHEVVRLVSPLAMSAARIQRLLAEDGAPGQPLADEAARVERLVTHLQAVMDAMRAYSHVPQLAFAVEPLGEIIVDAVTLARGSRVSADTPDIVVEIDQALTAEVCRARLLQAFTNLLSNAVESYDIPAAALGATPSAVPPARMRPILVSAERLDGRVEVTIRDAGRGMSPEVLADAPVLFSTNKSGGTGFGLPLAIKIVESEHGGRLRLDSEKGRGTVARVVLPASRSHAPSSVTVGSVDR